MYKGLRLIKRMVALFLVLLLSIESFGAVVSDNDGSAFITKAEFDSLKNNFQSQIDQYNISIDSKIDGAIASYLAGISTTKTEVKSLIVKDWDEYTILNGCIDNTYVFPDIDFHASLFVDYSTKGTEEVVRGSRKVHWVLGHGSRTYEGQRNKKVLVTNVGISSSLDTSDMTWFGIGNNVKEKWVCAGQYMTNTDDPGFFNQSYIEDEYWKFCTYGHLNGRQGFIDEYSDVTRPIWKPSFLWMGYNATAGTQRPCPVQNATVYTLTEAASIEYNNGGSNNMPFSYQHLGNWKYNTDWEVNVKDAINYLTVSPNLNWTSTNMFSSLLKSGYWSGMEIQTQDVMTGFVRRKSAVFTDGTNGKVESPDPVGIPTLGLLPNRYTASRIYQYERLIDSEGDVVPRLTMEQGVPIMKVEENEIIEWEPQFSFSNVPGGPIFTEVVVVLSYKPFTNGRMTYYEPDTQDINDYVKVDGLDLGVFPITTNGKVKIKFESDRNGYVYAKWFPNISDSDIESKVWETRLNIEACNTYKSTKE